MKFSEESCLNVTDCKAAVILHLSVCGGNCLHDFNCCSIVHGGPFVCAVKEQLAGDGDLKEYNVKSEDTNESSSGIFLFNSVTMFLVFLRGFSPWWPPSLLSPSFLTTF